MGSKKKITPSQPVSENGGTSTSSPASSNSGTSSSDNVPVVPEPSYEPAVNEASPIELGSVQTSAKRVNPLMDSSLQSRIPVERQNQLVDEVNQQSEIEKRFSDRLSQIKNIYDTVNPNVKKGVKSEDTVSKAIPDSERSGNRAVYLYNKVLDGIGSVAAGLGDVGVQFTNKIYGIENGDEVLKSYREQYAPGQREVYTDQLGGKLDKGLEAKYNDETFTSSLGGLASSTFPIALTAGSGGLGAGAMFLQSYDNALESINQSEAGRNLDEGTKTFFAGGVGLVTSALEKYGLDKIFKGETGVIANLITNQAIKQATRKTGGKITGDVLTEFLDKEILNLSNRFVKGGAKALDGALVEYGTEALQEGAQAGAELLVNKETGTPVFDTTETSTWQGFLARMNKAGIMGAIGGGLLGSVAGIAQNVRPSEVLSNEQSLSDINTALQNENLSESSKELLVQNKIELQNKLQQAAHNVDEAYKKLDASQKEEVNSLVEQKVKIQDAINDPQLPDEVKKTLQEQSSAIDKQLSEIKPIDDIKPDKPIITPKETEVVAEPTVEQKFKDIQDGNTVTFTYEKESDIPESLKDRISSKGETNGKEIYRVTISKSEADYLINKEIIKPTQNEEIQQPLSESKNVEEVSTPAPEKTSAEAGKEIIKTKDIPSTKEAISFVFEKNPEVGKIGDGKEYSEYITEKYPDSKVQEVVYRADNYFEENKGYLSDKSSVKNNKFSENGIYFADNIDQIEGYGKKENVRAHIVDLKNPRRLYVPHKQSNLSHLNEGLDFMNLSKKDIEKLKKEGYDGIVVDSEPSNFTVGEETVNEPYKSHYEIIAFDTKQVHVLGSEKDVENFKKWKENKNADLPKEEPTAEKGKVTSEVKKPDWQREVPESELRAHQQGYTVNHIMTIGSSLEPRKNFKNRSRMEDAIRSKEITFDEAISVIESAGLEVPQSIYKLKPVKSGRTLSEIESDQKTLMARYQDALKEAGLYELAKEGKAPEKELNEIKIKFSKEAESLKAEKSALNENPVEDKNPEELSLAEKVRTRKVGKGKAFESILGIPVAIYDGALETIATAIEAGSSIKDAIKAAVAYFKDKSEVKDDVAIEKELRRVLEEGGLLIKGTDEANPVPDVITEIEDSPEFIADENIAEFKKRLGKVLDNAKAQTLIKTGVGKADLAMKAIQLVSEIKDRKSMLEAARAVKKLFNDVVDNTYRSQIEQAKKGLKTRLKSSALAKVEVIKKFIGIDEKTLNTKELEQYNELVRQLNEQYNSKIEGVIADSDLQKFVDKIADRKAKEIEQEQLGEVAEEETDTEKSKSDEKSGRRKQLEAVVAINRQELRKSSYSEKYKVVGQALNRIDVDKLSNADMVKLNLALINLSVNDRLVGHEKVFKDYIGQEGIKRVWPLADKVKGILESALGASARSFDVNTKIIFKGIKDAAEFQRETGIAGISNANSQVKNIDMKAIDRDYQTLIKSMNFADYNTADNRFLRALYSNSTQFGSIEGQGKDFNRYKSLIKQSAEKLVASKDIKEQREGKLRMDQYTEYLEPYENRQDFEEAFKKAQPQNVKVVDFFRNKFNDKYGELKTNSQIYAGKNLKDENNYLPIKYKRYSGTETEQEKEMNDIVDPVYEFDPETGDISEKQSSTTIARSNVTKIKDTDRIMDMDFDRYIFDKYREMNYDIRTLKFRHEYNAIRSQEEFKNVVGGPENSNVLTSGVRNMVKRQMGGTFDNDVLNGAIRATRVVTGKAVRQALFGVLQPLKQYPSVAIRTAINLNTDLGLLFKGMMVGKDNPIFDNFGVGLRSTTRGGTQTETELGRIYKADFSSSPAKLAHAINRIGQKTADVLSKPLTFSDDAIAKHSWLAYYMKHIRDNGGDISKIDWETEHINPDQSAGAYADLMVSTTQNTNDNAKQADLLAERKYAIGRDLIAPFVSFARNSQANLEADLRIFSGGTAAEKRSAAVGILSTISEQAAFNTIKAVIAAVLIKQGANYVRHLFGDDEEGSESQEGMGTKILKNTSSDVLFSGMGSLANYWAIKGVNQVNKVATGGDKDLFYQYDPGKFGEPDFGAAGLFGTLPQSIYNAGQKADYLDGTLTDTYTNKGKEFKATVELSDKDRQMVTTLFFLDALSIAGLSDAEISRINQTMFRDIKKRTAPVKRFQVEAPNKKAGAMREKL